MDEHTTNTPRRDEDILRQIRADLQAGNLIGPGSLSQAEELLDGVEERSAEWHFLKGAICYRKGWIDEAQRHYGEAFRMEPGNPEYKETVKRMRGRKWYRPKGTPAGTLSAAIPVLAACLGGACAYCGWCSCCTVCCCKGCVDFCRSCPD